MKSDALKDAVVTFGCRVNQADSLLVEDGLRAASDGRAARTSGSGCRQYLFGHGERRPERSPNHSSHCALEPVGPSGCDRMLCDAPSGRSIRAAKRRPRRANGEKDALVSNIAQDVGLTTAERFSDGDGPCGRTLQPGTAGRTALTLRTDWLRGARSYCIIPQTRGHSRSRPLGQVIDDVHCAITAGYKEIAITGVHLGSYGRDLHDGLSLAHLVLTLAEIDDDVVFRISSLEPMDCTDDIVEIVASSSRLAPHFHPAAKWL